MTDGITLIFPDQLFEDHPAIASGRTIYLVEEFLFFKVQPFHKQRLVLLKAAMRAFAKKLAEHHHKVIYIPSNELNERGTLFSRLAKHPFKNIHLAEFADEWLHQDLTDAALNHGWNLIFYPSPGYICTNQELTRFFAGKKHFSMAQFYVYQRKRLDILMDGSHPVGGKFSFDVDNRKKIPKGLRIPPPFTPKKSHEIDSIIEEVDNEFPEAIGQAHPFLYPHTHEEAIGQFHTFLSEKFLHYGEYQDAIQQGQSTLFHSILSPVLNIGLITPKIVVETTLAFASHHSVPLNSLEGFIRQIIGWREFVRGSYYLDGSEQRSNNFFSHHHKIPSSFWKGATGILPIDSIIQTVLRTGYCNHIERLMVLGNFLLLTESSPHEVYHWFMGFFVDAYDWVMVPNVYGMSQYADGGKIVTKPYVSGSNYLLKMSNFPKGAWTDIWDGLFWRFLNRHASVFGANPRTLVLLQLFKKNEQNISPKIHKAEQWLKKYRAENPNSDI